MAIRGWGLGGRNGCWSYGWVVGWNPTLQLLLILGLLLLPSQVLAEPSTPVFQTIIDPSLASSFTCRGRAGRTVATGVGFVIQMVSLESDSTQPEFSVVDQSGCSLSFYGKEASVGTGPDVLEFGVPPEERPKLRRIAYGFASQLLADTLEVARDSCKDRDSVEIVPGYNASKYALCVERKIRGAMKRVGIAYIFPGGDSARQIQVWVDRGKILGVAAYAKTATGSDAVLELKIGERK